LELHVVFNYSAAASIRHVLVGREAVVARFSDDLSYGPIDPPEPAMRRAWIDDHLGFDNPDIADDESSFWAKVLAQDTSRTAWVSRRSAAEYCGFLEYLRRLGDLSTQIVDTTDWKCDDGEFFRSTGSIPASHILSKGLLGTVREVGVDMRSDCLALWKKLRTENSALRVVDQDLTLSSAPLSFYDQQLLSLAGFDWRPMARIVGDILVRETVSDLLLFPRLYALVDAGMLTARESDRHHPDVKLVSP
jgi:hypothetical protein